MLFIGDHKTLIQGPNVRVFNISSLSESYPRLNIFPYHNMDFFDDQAYANLLLMDDYKFMQMMYIIMTLYEGQHVYLLISKGVQEADEVLESFLKFIQQRYGYNYYIINEMDDYDQLSLLKVESDFSLLGVYNLDIDKERFIRLQCEGLMRNGAESVPEGKVFITI